MEVIKKRYVAVYKEFYFYMSGERATYLSDIPSNVMEFMAGMEYLELTKPLIVRGLIRGIAIKKLASIYGVNHETVRRLNNRFVKVRKAYPKKLKS